MRRHPVFATLDILNISRFDQANTRFTAVRQQDKLRETHGKDAVVA
ncbi:MAG: hypothetical protein IPK58_01610 [Acidobacteria bacterium]|nr:hypothetical protein [Acidobacteriota bacterium]